MSSCWRCGKDLPEGQVECENGCGSDVKDKGSIICFHLEAQADPAKLETEKQKQDFNKAAEKFKEKIIVLFLQCGLDKFCKPNI